MSTFTYSILLVCLSESIVLGDREREMLKSPEANAESLPDDEEELEQRVSCDLPWLAKEDVQTLAHAFKKAMLVAEQEF